MFLRTIVVELEHFIYKQRNIILKDLLGSFPDGCCIESPFYCDYGSNIHLEENVFMNFNCTLLDICEIRIGSGTLFAPGVQVYAATHPVDPIERRTTEYGRKVTIGKDCWIGGAAIICPGKLLQLIQDSD